jgi:hypothetical protein
MSELTTFYRKVFLTLLLLFSLVLSLTFFLWAFVYEVIVWQKSLLESFASSWWNWLLFVGFLFLTALINTYIETPCKLKKPEKKKQPPQTIVEEGIETEEYGEPGECAGAESDDIYEEEPRET